MNQIEIKNLTKTYGQTLALDGINLTLEGQKIYGLLGRNGAGKTTLLNLLTNKIFPTRGQITLAGLPITENDRALRQIFYMAEENWYPRALRVRGILHWTKEFYPQFDLAYALDLAERFELEPKKKFKELSTGYVSILKAILTLASNAGILLFDEPILGLDANHRDLLYKEILANYIAQPKTVLISTHLIDEVADILEEVIVIKKGKILLQSSVEELLASSYVVSGEAAKVDQYIQGRNWVGAQTLRNAKSVIVVNGVKDQALARSLDLECDKVELQRLFIGITGS